MAVEAGAETGIFPADDTTARVPRRAHRPAVDGGALRPRRRVRADAARSTSTRSTPLVALPHSARERRAGRGRGRHEDRPGLHRQLLERDDDRPAPGGRDPARAHACIRDCRADRRPGDAADLPRGDARGPARRLRRGGRDGLDADVRRLLRRPHGRPRPRASARVTTTNRNFKGRMGSPRGRGPPRERVRRRGGRGRRRDRRPGRGARGCRA